MELGIKGSIVMTASMTLYRPNRMSEVQSIRHDEVNHQLFLGCSLCSLRCDKSGRPQYVPHVSHGMEQTRHSRQQYLAGIRENSHDLLRRTRARLGPQDAILRWDAASGRSSRAGRCLRVPVE